MQVLYEGAGVYEQRGVHRLRSLGWRNRAILLWGKLRRFFGPNTSKPALLVA